MDAPNKEIVSLYTDCRKSEYNHINNLGHWVKKEDTQILALTASLQYLQSKSTRLQSRYSSLQALVASKKNNASDTKPPPTHTKLNKPPPKKGGEPDFITFEG